jgi:hypothetical protein
MVTPQGRAITLTDEELDSKFQECGMPEILKRCRPQPADRDPDVLTVPPYTSVVHKREKGFWYITEEKEAIALIFHWEQPDGTEKQSVRRFRTPEGQWYKRRARDVFA